MAKAEWGTKRRCQNCGAAFYDLSKSPIVCPKCETVFQPEVILKPKRARPEEKPKPVPKKEEPAEEAPPEAADDEGEDEFIEDADELGDEDDDVAEVVDPDDAGPEER